MRRERFVRRWVFPVFALAAVAVAVGLLAGAVHARVDADRVARAGRCTGLGRAHCSADVPGTVVGLESFTRRRARDARYATVRTAEGDWRVSLAYADDYDALASGDRVTLRLYSDTAVGLFLRGRRLTPTSDPRYLFVDRLVDGIGALLFAVACAAFVVSDRRGRWAPRPATAVAFLAGWIGGGAVLLANDGLELSHTAALAGGLGAGVAVGGAAAFRLRGRRVSAPA